MERLYREFKRQGLEVVAVNIKESKKEVQKFFGDLGLTFTAKTRRRSRRSCEKEILLMHVGRGALDLKRE